MDREEQRNSCLVFSTRMIECVETHFGCVKIVMLWNLLCSILYGIYMEMNSIEQDYVRFFKNISLPILMYFKLLDITMQDTCIFSFAPKFRIGLSKSDFFSCYLCDVYW